MQRKYNLLSCLIFSSPQIKEPHQLLRLQHHSSSCWCSDSGIYKLFQCDCFLTESSGPVNTIISYMSSYLDWNPHRLSRFSIQMNQTVPYQWFILCIGILIFSGSSSLCIFHQIYQYFRFHSMILSNKLTVLRNEGSHKKHGVLIQILSFRYFAIYWIFVHLKCTVFIYYQSKNHVLLRWC